MSYGRELNLWIIRYQIGVQIHSIELKSAQKFKIQVQNSNFSKSISSDREFDSRNFDIKFVPRFGSNQPRVKLKSKLSSN